jgi:hypothetical protein
MAGILPFTVVARQGNTEGLSSHKTERFQYRCCRHVLGSRI